jgi:hypothetical protein
VDMIEEDGGRGGRRELAITKPDLKTFVSDRIRDSSRMGMLHPKHFGEVIHFKS